MFILHAAALLLAAAAPHDEHAAPPPAAVANGLPSEWTLAGQQEICGSGPRKRTFELKAEEREVPIGNGWRVQAMTLGGRLAPVLEACQGDTVTLTMTNTGEMAHGIDSHAFRVNPDLFGPVDTGGTVSYSGKMEIPGAFMFHCASGPVTDTHIKSGMWGAMIVYPRKPLRRAREVAILQGGLFGAPDKDGVIHQDSDRIARNDAFTLLFNGRAEHEMVRVHPGELVRIWFVNAGPGISSPHVMGTLFEHASASGNPKNAESDVQTALVPAGGGAMLEFRPPTTGMYMLVDHDNLRFLSYGFAIGFMSEAPQHAAGRRPR